MWTAWNAFPHFDRLLDDAMSGAVGSAQSPRAYQPAIDVRTNAQEIVFVCDVPGLREEDLEVSLEEDTLTIKGKRPYDGSEKDNVWLGRRYGAFSKSYKLPDLVDGENLSATLEYGVLTVRVPRKQKPEPRRVQVKIGGAARESLPSETTKKSPDDTNGGS